MLFFCALRFVDGIFGKLYFFVDIFGVLCYALSGKCEGHAVASSSGEWQEPESMVRDSGSFFDLCVPVFAASPVLC